MLDWYCLLFPSEAVLNVVAVGIVSPRRRQFFEYAYVRVVDG